MTRYRLGVVDTVFFAEPDVVQRARRADELGFEHIDPSDEVDTSALPIPVGCPTSFPKPRPGWCSTPAPRDGPGRWERTVTWFTGAPGALLEPWHDATVRSRESADAMIAEVPGLRLLVDTGHVANWGGDPLEMLDLADHIQLRQGKPGATQLHPDDPSGVVDFRAVLQRLDDLDYQGCLSVEYFDLPDFDWPLDDPVGWAVALRAQLLPLLA